MVEYNLRIVWIGNLAGNAKSAVSSGTGQPLPLVIIAKRGTQKMNIPTDVKRIYLASPYSHADGDIR